MTNRLIATAACALLWVSGAGAAQATEEIRVGVLYPTTGFGLIFGKLMANFASPSPGLRQ